MNLFNQVCDCQCYLGIEFGQLHVIGHTMCVLEKYGHGLLCSLSLHYFMFPILPFPYTRPHMHSVPGLKPCYISPQHWQAHARTSVGSL